MTEPSPLGSFRTLDFRFWFTHLSLRSHAVSFKPNSPGKKDYSIPRPCLSSPKGIPNLQTQLLDVQPTLMQPLFPTTRSALLLVPVGACRKYQADLLPYRCFQVTFSTNLCLKPRTRQGTRYTRDPSQAFHPVQSKHPY
ncbi:Hypothetical predicted protein [Pelobates cultripes]|uniref:Uncharacterized protein n=1 Tax=Pelobates cultripes TaxID=61616 RepID=A0AAD1WG05_PELCU|nr:Hypothetical predicted protein [Pelobates cultripes]